jgi:hypothetical protein
MLLLMLLLLLLMILMLLILLLLPLLLLLLLHVLLLLLFHALGMLLRFRAGTRSTWPSWCSHGGVQPAMFATKPFNLLPQS